MQRSVFLKRVADLFALSDGTRSGHIAPIAAMQLKHLHPSLAGLLFPQDTSKTSEHVPAASIGSGAPLEFPRKTSQTLPPQLQKSREPDSEDDDDDDDEEQPEYSFPPVEEIKSMVRQEGSISLQIDASSSTCLDLRLSERACSVGFHEC